MKKSKSRYKKIKFLNKKRIENFLERISGKVHFIILIKNKPALEIRLRNKEIIVDIKNPILALTLGLGQFTKKKNHADFGWVNELKRLGYKIKIKYKMFKFDL